MLPVATLATTNFLVFPQVAFSLRFGNPCVVPARGATLSAPLYGLSGPGAAHIRRNFGEFEVTESGLFYGLGGDFALGNGAALNIEWSRLSSGTNFGYDYGVDIASIGMVFRL